MCKNTVKMRGTMPKKQRFTEVLVVAIEPVAEISNEFDIRVSNCDMRRVRNTEQRRKNMWHRRVVKSEQNATRSTP